MFQPTTMSNWDMTFAKTFPLKGEKSRGFTFRAEMYNIPNHTQWSGINTSARAPRQMAMTLRFQF